MDQLKRRILAEGKNLGSGILKVDGFINHQVDPALMEACGVELAERFRHVGATKVLTAEISGIAPALLTALPEILRGIGVAAGPIRLAVNGVVLEGVEILRIVGGRIRDFRVYFDTGPLLRGRG